MASEESKSDLLLSKDITSENTSNSLNKFTFATPENIGILLATISTFFAAFGTIFTKIIQRTYPDKFSTVPFLFLRSFTIVILSLIRTYYCNETILKLNEVKDRLCFFIRTNMNFFGMSSFTMAIWFLRTSTAQIIHSLNPILVFILSYIFIHEPFYFRYVIGIIMCICGSLFIVFNERDANKGIQIDNNHTPMETFYGVCLAFFSACTVSAVIISNKILVNNKVSINSQMFYVGVATMSYSTLYILFFGGVKWNLGYFAMCSFHGVFFFFGNIFYNYALQRCPLTKIVLVSYVNVVFVFILSSLFLHEPVFFTDLLGTGIILSYMIYNGYNPLPGKSQ